MDIDKLDEVSSKTSTFFGGKKMRYIIPQKNVIINDSTSKISVSLKPECALFLVVDEYALVDSAYIIRISDVLPTHQNEFNHNGKYKYSYFLPNEKAGDIYAKIIKKNRNILKMNTKNAQTGNIYKIKVTDEGDSQTIDLIADSIKNLIIW